jgi:hypothetical protein
MSQSHCIRSHCRAVLFRPTWAQGERRAAIPPYAGLPLVGDRLLAVETTVNAG